MSRDITSSMNKLILRIHWIENLLDKKTKEHIERNIEFKNESIEAYQKELNELKVEVSLFWWLLESYFQSNSNYTNVMKVTKK